MLLPIGCMCSSRAVYWQRPINFPNGAHDESHCAPPHGALLPSSSASQCALSWIKPEGGLRNLPPRLDTGGTQLGRPERDLLSDKGWVGNVRCRIVSH